MTEVRMRMGPEDLKEMLRKVKQLNVLDLQKIAELLYAAVTVADILHLQIEGDVTITQYGEQGVWKVTARDLIYNSWSEHGFYGGELREHNTVIDGLPSREVAAVWGLLTGAAQVEKSRKNYDAILRKMSDQNKEMTAQDEALLDLWDTMPKKRRLQLSEATRARVQGLVDKREADARADAMSWMD